MVFLCSVCNFVLLSQSLAHLLVQLYCVFCILVSVHHLGVMKYIGDRRCIFVFDRSYLHPNLHWFTPLLSEMGPMWAICVVTNWQNTACAACIVCTWIKHGKVCALCVAVTQFGQRNDREENGEGGRESVCVFAFPVSVFVHGIRSLCINE